MTVPMFNPDNGNTAEVHPDEVGNWKRHGWREREPAIEIYDMDAMRTEAEELGIVVDRRWGEKRLKDEIAKAKAA